MKPGHSAQPCAYTTSIQFHGTMTAFWTGLEKENLIEAEIENIWSYQVSTPRRSWLRLLMNPICDESPFLIPSIAFQSLPLKALWASETWEGEKELSPEPGTLNWAGADGSLKQACNMPWPLEVVGSGPPWGSSQTSCEGSYPHSASREPVCSRRQGLCLLPLHPQKVGMRGVEGLWDEESGRFGFLEPQFS